MGKNKMKNETEFILSPNLSKGFTVLSNEVYEYLSDNAVGLYRRIIMKSNIQNWKVYQSSLIDDLNKKEYVTKAMKELIDIGYIEEIQIRNEKGNIKGIKYIVHSSPIKKEDNVKHKKHIPLSKKINNSATIIQPNIEKPILLKRQLKNKEYKKKIILL